MKKLFLILIGLLPLLCGCNNDDDLTREEVITVASETREITSAISNINVQLIKGANDNNWKQVHGIGNLDYEEGYEYKIRVRITKNRYPKGAEVDYWYDESYTCIEVLSKMKKNSENMPEQNDWSILHGGNYLYNVCLRTPSGKNLLDSLGAGDGNMTSRIYTEQLASQLFDVRITKQTGEPISSDKIHYSIGHSAEDGTYLTVMFRDREIGRNDGGHDEKYCTTIVCKPDVWNDKPYQIDWYVHKPEYGFYDAYKCEVNGAEYPLESDKLDTKYKKEDHWLFAMLTLDL